VHPQQGMRRPAVGLRDRFEFGLAEYHPSMKALTPILASAISAAYHAI
jgi:hypothetical protein